MAVNSVMSAKLSNNLPKEITVTQIRCTQEKAFNAGTTLTGSTGTNRYQDIVDVKIPVGSTLSVGNFYCLKSNGALASGGTVGKNFQAKLYVKYYFSDERIPQYRVNSGELSLKYQP
ncbi:hypothetical protein HY992_02095 [Candidatus Micrarchaeota archaeon]|nr:hypothetical protein [Candidatus Micrarchaeota archaeon]